MRIRDPRTTALIFSSGKMVCTGAKRCALLCLELCPHIYQIHTNRLIKKSTGFTQCHGKVMEFEIWIPGQGKGLYFYLISFDSMVDK